MSWVDQCKGALFVHVRMEVQKIDVGQKGGYAGVFRSASKSSGIPEKVLKSWWIEKSNGGDGGASYSGETLFV